MDLDKKTVAGGIAAAAVGAIGAAVAYGVLGGRDARRSGLSPKAVAAKARRDGSAETPAGETLNINKASHHELTGLKHIGKARAKRILAARPFRSVDDLVARGLVPEEVLARHRDRLTV